MSKDTPMVNINSSIATIYPQDAKLLKKSNTNGKHSSIANQNNVQETSSKPTLQKTAHNQSHQFLEATHMKKNETTSLSHQV